MNSDAMNPEETDRKTGDRRETSQRESDEREADDMRVAKPRRAQPADAVRPTRAEINLGHLRHNLRELERAMQRPGDGKARPRAGTQGASAVEKAPTAEVWPVLKADAYGHGAPAVARTLERAGAKGICVALLEEGIELREAGIRVPILVMGGYYGPRNRGLEDAVAHGLVPVVYDREQIERLKIITSSSGTNGGSSGTNGSARTPIHLKIDTGMGRLGAPRAELDAILDALRAAPGVELRGLMSHLACADDAELAPTLAQLARFDEAADRVRARGFDPRIHHIANSAAALRLPSSRFAIVRPGISIYGVLPCERALVPSIDLRPVMRVRSEIVAIRSLAKGERVGYGHTYEAKGPRVVATIAMGYADGLSRALSNKGHVLVRGKRAPIAGVVSMDLTSIDVTDIAGAQVGDEVVVLGEQGANAITTQELADHMSTIPWEPLTHISRRVPRFYREP